MSTTISKALYLTFEFLADVSLAVSQTKQKTEQRFFYLFTFYFLVWVASKNMYKELQPAKGEVVACNREHCDT